MFNCKYYTLIYTKFHQFLSLNGCLSFLSLFVQNCYSKYSNLLTLDCLTIPYQPKFQRSPQDLIRRTQPCKVQKTCSKYQNSLDDLVDYCVQKYGRVINIAWDDVIQGRPRTSLDMDRTLDFDSYTLGEDLFLRRL